MERVCSRNEILDSLLINFIRENLRALTIMELLPKTTKVITLRYFIPCFKGIRSLYSFRRTMFRFRSLYSFYIGMDRRSNKNEEIYLRFILG